MIIGDGDNLAKVKGPLRKWFLERKARCCAAARVNGAGTNAGYALSIQQCFPLVWTIAPHLLHLAPDWLHWYYDMALETGHDYFVLPASGDMYSYPAMMKPSDRALFVERTETDAVLLNTSGLVEWEYHLSIPALL